MDAKEYIKASAVLALERMTDLHATFEADFFYWKGVYNACLALDKETTEANFPKTHPVRIDRAGYYEDIYRAYKAWHNDMLQNALKNHRATLLKTA